MTQHFVRHGDFLTVISVVVEFRCILGSRSFEARTTCSNLAQQLEPIHGEIVDEIAGRPDGYVPHHLPGTNDQLKEFAEHFGLPFEATRGGRDSTYPEYQLTLRRMAEQLARTSKRPTE